MTTVLLAILASYQVARILGLAAERGFPHDVVLGLRLRSNVIRAGRVIHAESPAEKEPGATPVPTVGAGPLGRHASR